jgi:hypothetical protein
MADMQSLLLLAKLEPAASASDAGSGSEARCKWAIISHHNRLATEAGRQLVSIKSHTLDFVPLSSAFVGED